MLALHFKMSVLSATVPMPDGQGSHSEINFGTSTSEEMAAVFMAGETGEQLIIGKISFVGAFNDIGQVSIIAELKDLNSTSLRNEGVEKAKAILPNYKDAVNRVANALQCQVNLSENELIDLFNG